MRIIAGEFRSRRLRAPRGWDTRPTSDRLRETLFNVLGNRVAGARFADLYAGSGANGLEALSRGAAEAVFVEQAPPALEALHSNVAALEVAARAQVAALPMARWLREAVAAARPFDLLFLDPPYAAGAEYAATLGALGDAGQKLLAPGALVIAEHRRPSRSGAGKQPESSAPGARYGALGRVRVLEQGDAALSFFVLSPLSGH